jgi:hypothetical protein
MRNGWTFYSFYISSLFGSAMLQHCHAGQSRARCVTVCYLLHLVGNNIGQHLLVCLRTTEFILALPDDECQLPVSMAAIVRSNGTA